MSGKRSEIFLLEVVGSNLGGGTIGPVLALLRKYKDNLWRAYDEVVPEIPLVVPEIAQMDRIEEKSGRSRS